MTKKRQKPVTAAELMAELANDACYQAKVAERDARIEQEMSLYRKEERPLVEALRAANVDVDSVWDLVARPEPYSAAIPVLLKHLQKPYLDRVKEGIARALAVPEARSGWHILAKEFESNPEKTTFGAKLGIALALSVAGDDEHLQEVLRLSRDSRHGENRIPLLDVLSNSEDASVRELIRDFVDDPEIGNYAAELLSRRTRSLRRKTQRRK